MHICESGYLCRYFDIYSMHSIVFYYLKNYSTSDICYFFPLSINLILFGEGGNITIKQPDNQ